MAFLQAIKGKLSGRRFEIPDKERVVVGRYEVYDLIVPDPSISRKHFAIEKRSDGHYIVDLGSLNGTQLNGHRVSTARLEEDDKISAGQTVLAFHEGLEDANDSDETMLIEPLTDADIIADPEDAPTHTTSPATIPMPVADPEALGVRVDGVRPSSVNPDKPSDHGTARTKRTTRKGAGGAAGRCAACGRKVSQADVDSGDCAKTRLGYVCSRCIEKRQQSGEKGSLEKFITERQRRRR